MRLKRMCGLRRRYLGQIICRNVNYKKYIGEEGRRPGGGGGVEGKEHFSAR
jgi:hypothetical protein